MNRSSRSSLKSCKRILVKIGSRVLNAGDGLNNRVIDRLCDDLSLLRDKGKEFALVSSGAIAEGNAVMKVSGSAMTLSKKQALAAIGQGSLIRTYTNAFKRYGYKAGQILITREDLDDRRRYLNIRNTFTALFDFGVIPIINENDTVSVDEIQFTDNDVLSAMIVPLVQAQAMIILTDTPGVYLDDPRKNPQAEMISEFKDIKPKDITEFGGDPGDMGRGGMKSKLEAAYHASLLGVPTVITSAYIPQVISAVLKGQEVGTFVHARQKGRLTQKNHWISFVTRPKGEVIIDSGAAQMLINKGKSLLPCGVVQVAGNFCAGDPVEIKEHSGEVIAVGLSNFTSDEIDRVKGAKTRDVCTILAYECDAEVVHRNNMILKKELDQ